MLNALVRPPNFLLFLTWLQGSENQVKRKKRGVEKINCLTRPVLPFFEKNYETRRGDGVPSDFNKGYLGTNSIQVCFVF